MSVPDESVSALEDLAARLVSDLATGRLVELAQARRRQAAVPSSPPRRSRVAPDERVYHPMRIGGRDVLAILAHDESPTHLYDLGDQHFAEGQRGFPGQVMRSGQWDRAELERLGWRQVWPQA